MLLSKQLLQVAKIASKDDTRPVLTAIKVYREDGKTVAVATDGYMLSEVIEDTPDSSDYPLLMDERKPVEVEEVLLPAKTAEKIGKAIVSKSAMPVLRYALLEGDRVSTTDLEEITSLGFRPIEGNYPDYRQLTPDENEVGRYVVHLDPALLKKALSQFGSERSVRLSISSSKLSPITLRSENEGVKKTVVIMPLKS